MQRTLLAFAVLLASILGASALSAGPNRAPAASPSSTDKIQVVATLPDLADLAQAIGGERVNVKTLARPGQNLHAVRVKPSHLVALSKADLFLQVGLSLEHAWVPGLLRTSRNRSVFPGTDGFVSAGEGYPMIEVPVRLDRAISADVHPAGNPHINISLSGGPHMAERIRDGLIRVDPQGAEAYRAGFTRWLSKYEVARARWDVISAAVAEKKESACLYHQEFDYLLGEMGLQIATFLEPRPGLPPTPSHLAEVIEVVKYRKIPVILTAPWSNNKNCRRVSELTGAPILELPVMVGGDAEHATWLQMMDCAIERIAAAYGVDAKAVLAAHAEQAPVEAGKS